MHGLFNTTTDKFCFFQANGLNDIEAVITIDNGGSLTVDTGEKHKLETDWWETERFILPGDTKVVTIKADNGAGGPGGISRYGAGIEHLRQHFFRSSYPCQLVTRLRCVYRGARMLTGNTCAMHQVLKFLLAKWLFKVICYSFTL